MPAFSVAITGNTGPSSGMTPFRDILRIPAQRRLLLAAIPADFADWFDYVAVVALIAYTRGEGQRQEAEGHRALTPSISDQRHHGDVIEPVGEIGRNGRKQQPALCRDADNVSERRHAQEDCPRLRCWQR